MVRTPTLDMGAFHVSRRSGAMRRRAPHLARSIQETPVLMHARLARLCTHKDLAWSSTTLDRALALGQNTRGARGCWSTSVHFDQTPYTSERLLWLSQARELDSRHSSMLHSLAAIDRRGPWNQPEVSWIWPVSTHLPPIVADLMEQWLHSMKMWPDDQTRPPANLLTFHSWSE